MECVGALNFSAMAVSACPAVKSFCRRRLRGEKHGIWPIRTGNCTYISTLSTAAAAVATLRVRCKSSGSSSAGVALREEFADEEDYVKAGGSEILFVQMQQNKNMEEQSKLLDTVDILIP